VGGARSAKAGAEPFVEPLVKDGLAVSPFPPSGLATSEALLSQRTLVTPPSLPRSGLATAVPWRQLSSLPLRTVNTVDEAGGLIVRSAVAEARRTLSEFGREPTAAELFGPAMSV
jgi:hypothetical protein